MSSLRRSRPKRKPINWKRLLWVAIPVAVLVLVNLPFMQVVDVRVAQSGTVPNDEVQRIVLRTLQERPFLIISRSFILFPQSNAVEHDIVQAFPRANRVLVKRTQLNEITISFEDRDPEGVWCAPDNTGCLLIDADGLGYGVAPETSSSVYLTIISTTSPKVGAHVLPIAEARVLLFTIHTLREKDEIEITHLTLSEEVYEATLKAGTRVLFTPATPLEEFAISLRSIVTSLKGKPAPEYIDLRFPGKAYFRIHGQSVDQAQEGE